MEDRRRSEESKENSNRAPSSDSGSANEKTAARASANSRLTVRNRKAILAIVLGCIIILGLALGLGLGLGLKNQPAKQGKPGQTRKPNVLVIMTDDQDLKLDSMSVMPNVNRLFGDQGTRFERHYCTVAWCCPSRVNFFTGRAAHNTNVTSTVFPYGGWYKFHEQGLNEDYLPVWINQTGIGTYYVGKFLNGYSTKNFHHPAYPKAWTGSEMLVDPYTYNYYNSHWTDGYTTKITGYEGIHTTTVTESKALSMIDKAAESENQFFMMVAPVAPHQELGVGPTRPPPIPPQYKGVFNNRIAPRTANFNPDVRSGASWVHDAEKLNSSQIEVCDETYYHRLANIAYIDDMVNALVERLDYHGILDNTYVIYTTDNGFHIGNHRLLPGKRCPYEEDVNIPLLIRGPDVPQGVNNSITNSHTDMAPTILRMLGLPLRDNFDGAPIAYTNEMMAQNNKTEVVNVEFWNGAAGAPIGLPENAYYNNTYKALRLLTPEYNFYYSTWCTGEREFYDMATDEQQLYNYFRGQGNTTQTYYGRSQADLIERLDAVLMVTKACKQDSCRNPWGVLFPRGEVTSLAEAMSSTYDGFFSVQPKVTFEKCTDGYIKSKEGPYDVKAFSPSTQYVLS